MCLAAVALDLSRRFPLVIAANRDEYHDRPAARLGWWRPHADGPEILAGRDLSAGGTWLGLNATGRLALLTNIRDPSRNDPKAPTRGDIPTRWLTTDQPPDRFWVRTSLSGHNGFNLIAADFSRGECYWMCNRSAYAQRLEKGLFGLSNGLLDEPWPKVTRLKQNLAEALAQHEDGGLSTEAFSQALLGALASRIRAPDDELPHTGVGLDLERTLSPAFIRSADGRYGTRCSTVIITERVGRNLVTQVWERSFPASAGMALMRRATLKDWPPRYATQPIQVPLGGPADSGQGSLSSPVTEDACAGLESDGATLAPAAPPATRTLRPRVRSLLKPAR